MACFPVDGHIYTHRANIEVRLSTQRYPNVNIVIIITAGDSINLIRYEDKTGPPSPVGSTMNSGSWSGKTHVLILQSGW